MNKYTVVSMSRKKTHDVIIDNQLVQHQGKKHI